MDAAGWRFTKHAVARALDMAVEPAEVRAALVDPESDEPSGRKYPPEVRLFKRGRIALAVNANTKEVITVMWNTGGYMSRTDDDELWWRD